MKEKTLDVLEYNKIIRLLTEQAGSAMARGILSELKPFSDVKQIREKLAETSEAVKLMVHKGPLPLSSFYDVIKNAEFARKGGVLTMLQLLHTKHDLAVARQVVNFMKSDVPELPIIKGICEVVVVTDRLEKDIDRCIVSEDEMSDNASTELYDIRRGIARQVDALKSRIDRMVCSEEYKTYLQDALVTIRDGRYVLPVKSEHRGHVPGVIHDESSSGATVFIEPQVIVDMNNELRELEIAERVEMDRILGALSEEVSEHYHDIVNNQKLLIELDVIMAKGKLSLIYEGEEPVIYKQGEGWLLLKGARHPLLDPETVVPTDIEIGRGYKTLVITGPNTGGKTVTLKTMGLLTLLAQSGLHIPAEERSSIPVFTSIYADIGDEQSIEQNLSTFSSHMKNIVEIVRDADEGSLILLDELGGGTDPTEGAMLAIAILEKLYDKGAITAATTHYTELKKYALSKEGVENASMEFDIETLSPTFKLSIGVPGRSNAFAISEKLGLESDITDKAKKMMDNGDLKFEEVITALEDDRRIAEEERDEAIMLNVVMKKKKEELDKKIKRFEEKKEKIISEAKQEARSIIKDSQDTAKEVQTELRELSKIENIGERNKLFDEGRKRLRDKAGQYKEKIIREVNNNPVAPEDLRLGDRVKLLTLNQKGELVGLPDDNGKIQVQVGSIKINSKINDIILIEGGVMDTNRPKKRKIRGHSYGKMFKEKAQNISSQIDVRGKNLDDALMEAEKYIDDVSMAGIEEVVIIHGRGEGILREGIRNMLKKHSNIKSFSSGGYYDGGEGVTIVKMKK